MNSKWDYRTVLSGRPPARRKKQQIHGAASPGAIISRHPERKRHLAPSGKYRLVARRDDRSPAQSKKIALDLLEP